MKAHGVFVMAGVLGLASGCMSIPGKETIGEDQSLASPSAVSMRLGDTMPAEVTVRDAGEIERGRRVTIVTSKGKLIDLLKEGLGAGIRVMVANPGVDLGKVVSVYAVDVTVQQFLDQLITASGYDMSFDGKTVRVSTVAQRDWDLTTLAGTVALSSSVGQSVLSGGGGSSGGGEAGEDSTGSSVDMSGGSSGSTPSSSTITEDSNAWSKLIEDAKSILSNNTPEGAPKPVVVGTKAMGKIHAVGYPPAMVVLSSYLDRVVQDAGKQVNLDVKIYEVTLEDSEARGIDWNVAFDTVFGSGVNMSIGNVAPVSLSNSNAFTVSMSGQVGDTTINQGVVNFLSHYGNVHLLNQPNVTVVNGRPAFISAGTEQSFMASVVQGQDQNGNIQITPTLDRVKLGVSLSVIPRVRDDGRIALTVVPVLSSLQGFRNFNVSGFDFQTPNVALEELSTIAIVEPGKTLHLGGLISRKMTKALNELPLFKDTGMTIVDMVKGSRSVESERRELYIQVTPHLVAGG